MATWTSRSVAQTRALGERLGRRLRGGEVVLLCGDLGVGKTQFAQGVGLALGVRGPMLSPTFTLAVQYEARLPLVHYDLYRVQHPDELREMGYLEFDDAATVALIEWGDRVTPPTGAVQVFLEVESEARRRITIAGLTLDPAGSA
jgi:tRNA threonylcarbamoyladenosine biosynthesis protein TsaE